MDIDNLVQLSLCFNTEATRYYNLANKFEDRSKLENRPIIKLIFDNMASEYMNLSVYNMKKYRQTLRILRKLGYSTLGYKLEQ